ncbi:MAG TPA: lysylphosphatidylglycerol synthase transmembrane domain-containing protein [Kofleriaceae bacterium]|nr:lysylphosphatidylglycerol synthase transmembrane domain-containing protein [Kofleriaceae bacterium]
MDADNTRIAPKHSWVWMVLLAASGALGIYVAAPDTAVLHAAWSRLADVPIAALAIVIAGALGLVATEALRIAVIGRIAGARVGARDAWDAAVANHVMTAVTPQVGLGEPTVAYTLAKRGVPWDAAVAIPFVKFTTSLALVFVLGAVLVATGFGPKTEAWLTAGAIVWFGAIAAITVLVIAVCSSERVAPRWIAAIARWTKRRRVLAKWQDRITRAEAVTSRTVLRVAAVRGVTAIDAALLVVVHLVYYASYIAPLVGLAVVLGDPPFVTLCLRSMVYLCFVFAMPTPGGVGPSEAAAAWFFGDLVAPADAIVIVVVFRASTFYLQLAIGALYLPIRALAR